MEIKYKKFNITRVIETVRGFYSFLELKDAPAFPVKQVYFIQDFKQPTGQHCHKAQEEIFMMVKGSCMAVIDHGNGKEDVPFKFPGEAIYVGAYAWHGFKDFSPDAVILALSSTEYSPDRSDYIEDYDEYQKVIKV